MRRADPSADGDGPPLPAYADADVGSSPRALGVLAGGRPGYPPEGPPVQALKSDDNAFARVKLMCSYGGRILPRPHHNQLRYVGGDSRIAVVSRNITFSELSAKLSRMFGSAVIIKYQLPCEDLDALISVTSDEDLENMMEEYDRLQSVAFQNVQNVSNRSSATARLRLFLFPSLLEMSQTSSFSDMMENNPSHERWFVDMLNGLPVRSRGRSETSSIVSSTVSETLDNSFQGNMDTLEEWAAAASYGNSLTSTTEESTDRKQGNPVSPRNLFGSLLQQATSNEAVMVPGSPSPIKSNPTEMGSYFSALPAVLSGIAFSAHAAHNGLPTKPMEADGLIDNFSTKIQLGSADSSGSIPEQRKHVSNETLLSSDKNILSSSVGGAEQVLPARSMDDEDISQKLHPPGIMNVDDKLQKYFAMGSVYEENLSSEAAVLEAGLHQVIPEASKNYEGDAVSQTIALTGQPIFDVEASTTDMLGCNSNVVSGEEGALLQKVISPSSTYSAPAPLMPLGRKPEQVVSKSGPNEKLKHYEFPNLPHPGAYVNNEEKTVQQHLPSIVLDVMTAPEGDMDDESSRLTPPSFAHFLPSQMASQQPSTAVTGDNTVLPQVLGDNVTQDADSIHHYQGTPITGPAQQENLPLVHGPSFFHQQPSTRGLEVPFSAGMQVTQAPPIPLPFTSQVASPVMGMVSKPLPPITVPARPPNVVTPSRPATGLSRPQSSPVATQQYASPLISQVQATGSSSPLGLGTLRGTAPVSSNVVPTVSTIIISTNREGISTRGIPNIQGDMGDIHRQGGDPIHGPRMAAIVPELGTQYNEASANVPHAPGMPTCFRAVGHPLPQVVEGVPLQQAALAGIISDKKAPSAILMAGPSPSVRPLSAPGGDCSYAAAALQSPTEVGGNPRYHTPSNVVLGVPASSSEMSPLIGANPFVDGFERASAYQDATRGPPADQNQRYPMRQK